MRMEVQPGALTDAGSRQSDISRGGKEVLVDPLDSPDLPA
jgi:hypothetical protein